MRYSESGIFAPVQRNITEVPVGLEEFRSSQKEIKR